MAVVEIHEVGGVPLSREPVEVSVAVDVAKGVPLSVEPSRGNAGHGEGAGPVVQVDRPSSEPAALRHDDARCVLVMDDELGFQGPTQKRMNGVLVKWASMVFQSSCISDLFFKRAMIVDPDGQIITETNESDELVTSVIDYQKTNLKGLCFSRDISAYGPLMDESLQRAVEEEGRETRMKNDHEKYKHIFENPNHVEEVISKIKV